jgi:hypothetical protein
MRRSCVLRSITQAALASSMLYGCALENEVSTDQRPIVNGELDFGDPAVVHLSIQGAGGGWGCSGTLISPRVVLTAQHCVDGYRAGTAFFGHDPDGVGTRIQLVGATGHSSMDIGMVALRNAAPATPIPYSDRAPGPYVGNEVRIVGFGATAEDEPGGVKRKGRTRLHSVDSENLLIAFDGRSATCYGDSGGPYFMTFNGVEHVAGVTSWGTSPCGAPPQGGTRTDVVSGWIRAYVDQIDGGGPGPTGVTFFQHIDYGGAASGVKARGNYATLPGDIPNDWMSSLRVPAGWTVEAYEHIDFGGAVCTYRGDTAWVGSGCNDRMSSFRIY